MQVRVITMRYSEGYKGFCEDDLRGATFGREVLSVETNMTREAGASRPAPKVPADIFKQQLKGTDK